MLCKTKFYKVENQRNQVKEKSRKDPWYKQSELRKY